MGTQPVAKSINGSLVVARVCDVRLLLYRL